MTSRVGGAGGGVLSDSTELAAPWREWSTGTVYDALQRLGLDRYVPGILPVSGAGSVVGRAFTVAYRSADTVAPGTVGDFIDDVAPGEVVLLSNPSRIDCTVWGDILTLVAHRNGVAGTVIDGSCRDTRRAVDLGYPLFARAHTMRTGKTRVEVSEVGGSVSIGEAGVRNGDLIVGDRDGICVVPWSRVDEVAEVAHEIDTAERRIEELVADGASLVDARRKLGYHSLQDRR